MCRETAATELTALETFVNAELAAAVTFMAPVQSGMCGLFLIDVQRKRRQSRLFFVGLSCDIGGSVVYF